MTTQNEVAVNGGGKQYGTKLTVLGEAAIAANILAGTKLDVVEIAAGDGGAATTSPRRSRPRWSGRSGGRRLPPMR